MFINKCLSFISISYKSCDLLKSLSHIANYLTNHTHHGWLKILMHSFTYHLTSLSNLIFHFPLWRGLSNLAHVPTLSYRHMAKMGRISEWTQLGAAQTGYRSITSLQDLQKPGLMLKMETALIWLKSSIKHEQVFCHKFFERLTVTIYLYLSVV